MYRVPVFLVSFRTSTVTNSSNSTLEPNWSLSDCNHYRMSGRGLDTKTVLRSSAWISSTHRVIFLQVVVSLFDTRPIRGGKAFLSRKQPLFYFDGEIYFCCVLELMWSYLIPCSANGVSIRSPRPSSTRCRNVLSMQEWRFLYFQRELWVPYIIAASFPRYPVSNDHPSARCTNLFCFNNASISIIIIWHHIFRVCVLICAATDTPIFAERRPFLDFWFSFLALRTSPRFVGKLIPFTTKAVS